MKSYKFLATISVIIQILATLILVGGVILFFIFLNDVGQKSYANSDLLGDDYVFAFKMLLGSIIAFLLLMASAQFITLVIDVAKNISNIDNNLYIIAKSTESQKSTENKINDNDL